MPKKVQIMSLRNSADWDALVRDVINAGAFREQNIYGGIKKEVRADEVRRCIRTAGKHLGVASLVRYIECPDRGRCPYDPDCAYHVLFTIFTIEEGRAYKQQQAQQQAQQHR